MTTNTEGENSNALSDMGKKVLGRMRREVGESKLLSCRIFYYPCMNRLDYDPGTREEPLGLGCVSKRPVNHIMDKT